jgi:hypothetical protein
MGEMRCVMQRSVTSAFTTNDQYKRVDYASLERFCRFQVISLCLLGKITQLVPFLYPTWISPPHNAAKVLRYGPTDNPRLPEMQPPRDPEEYLDYSEADMLARKADLTSQSKKDLQDLRKIRACIRQQEKLVDQLPFRLSKAAEEVARRESRRLRKARLLLSAYRALEATLFRRHHRDRAEIGRIEREIEWRSRNLLFDGESDSD